MATPAINIGIDYSQEKVKIKELLDKYQPTEFANFGDLLAEVAQQRVSKIEIELDQLANLADQSLLQNIEQNTKRYTSLFCQVVDSMLPDQSDQPTDDSDPLSVLIYQRTKRNQEDGNGPTSFPPELVRK
ncbi:Mcm2-7 hexameric complex component [Boothiomyces macroporosus]|uniref:Mcm2-7 hexameric complex component n=1 Tax=Boothiomyces macroporosus TaxID=261099 RepID=A0AAD5UKW2_9FUNG|nr:Mcm2-7 hexameric complex component [Boothiomyces macroporosus]